MMAMDHLLPFTWVGFYPGKVSATYNRKRKDHTMGAGELFIIAQHEIQHGVHMINEAGRDAGANVWYTKLASGYVLYFIGVEVLPGEELLTCYARGYGKRCYPVPSKCTDPRCIAAGKHRDESPMLSEWVEALLASKPDSLEIPLGFLA